MISQYLLSPRNQSILSALLTAFFGLSAIYLISFRPLTSENSFLFLVTSSTLFVTVYQNISFTLVLPFYPLLDQGQSIRTYRLNVVRPLLFTSLVVFLLLSLFLFSVDFESTQFSYLYSRDFVTLLLFNYLLCAVLPFAFLKSFYYGRYLESSLITFLPPLTLSFFLLVSTQPSPSLVALFSLITRIFLLIYATTYIRPLKPLSNSASFNPSQTPKIPNISAHTTFVFLAANLVFLAVSFFTESYIALLPSTIYLLTTIASRIFFLPSSLFIEPYLQTYRRQLVQLVSTNSNPASLVSILIERSLLVSLFFYILLILALPSLASFYLYSVNLHTHQNLSYLFKMTFLMLPALPLWSVYGVLSRYLESSSTIIKPSIYGSICYLLFLASLILLTKLTAIYAVPISRLLLYGLFFPVQAVLLSSAKFQSTGFFPPLTPKQNPGLLLYILASITASLSSLYLFTNQYYLFPVL